MGPDAGPMGDRCVSGSSNRGAVTLFSTHRLQPPEARGFATDPVFATHAYDVGGWDDLDLGRSIQTNDVMRVWLHLRCLDTDGLHRVFEERAEVHHPADGAPAVSVG